MNGSRGCLPDNNEIHFTKESAIKSLAELFSETRGVKTDLRKYGFCDRDLLGADYCEIVVCYDSECLEEIEF